MTARLNTADAGFAETFSQFLGLREEQSEQVSDVVKAIIADVAEYGDNALINHTRKFDRFEATVETLQVTPEEIAQAISLCSPELIKSLKIAAARIKAYSEKQLPANLNYADESGIRLGHRWTPIDAVGLYVPGGTAVYPSSVLMNAVPAKVAGVQKLIITMPAREGKLHPSLLAAAHIAGVDAIYKVGGAQAIAAMAFGTQTIDPVDKIVGPGNAYVAEAKRQVFGKVGIDMIAGPSEILVIADNKNNPKWIAADLLSQAEHDTLAQSVLITDDAAFANAVEKEIIAMLATLPRREIAESSWKNYGAVIVVKDWQEAADITNAIAPEHAELAVETPEKLLPLIRHAGAIFLGRHTPEAIGDYVAGPSHVLPTSRTARFSSGLSVFDFMKRTSIIGCSEQSLANISDYAETLAETEGLHAHGLSVSLRRK
jgi:histidinol dehydrogenase